MDEETKGQEGQTGVATPPGAAPTSLEGTPTPAQPTPPDISADPRYKGLQREYQKAQDKIRAYEAQGLAVDELKAEVATVRTQMEALLTIAAEAPPSSGEVEWTPEGEKPKPSKAQQLVEQIRQRTQLEKQQAEWQRVWNEYAQWNEGEVNTTFNEADIPADDPQREVPNKLLNEAKALLKEGKPEQAQKTFDRARGESRRIALAFAKGQTTRREAEEARAEAERKEQLKTEPGLGGGSSTWKEIEEAWAAGKISLAQYSDARKKRGL